MIRGYSPHCSCLHCKGIRHDRKEDAKPMYGRSIKLAVAGFCVNCDAVVDRLNSCPDCGSTSLMNLARVLNREVA